MPQFHLREYVATQATESYRAFIIHGPAMSGKTRLARRAAAVLDAHVLDLQAYFVARPDLCARIDRYRPTDLEQLLRTLDTPATLVVIDNADFLLNVWTPHHKHTFVAMIERRLRSPSDTERTFCFLIQTDPIITRHQLTNTHGQPRVLPLDAFYAL